MHANHEVSLNTNQMDLPPKEQQSQQTVQRNPNAYKTMRDHIHPPRVSAPSCIVPPTKDECQALSGAPAPNFPWYGKGKSVHTNQEV